MIPVCVGRDPRRRGCVCDYGCCQHGQNRRIKELFDIQEKGIR